jgi:hypothetical protein
LASIAKGASVSEAARKALIARSAAYAWRADDAVFAAEWDSATEESVDALEAEARRRALKQSDLLMIFLLRHRRPDVFRPPNKVAHGGDADAPPIKTEGRVVIFLPENGRAYPAPSDAADR